MIPVRDNEDILIYSDRRIRDALKQMDKASEGILFVVDEVGRLLGTLTDGDIRRGLLSGRGMNDPIVGVFNPHPFFMTENEYDSSAVTKAIREQKFDAVPIVDQHGKVVCYEKKDELLDKGVISAQQGSIAVPVVIMAGGKGTRMAPFTNVLPKPLIPLGEKTILELIIDEFRKFGASSFFVTINYRGDMIRAYFDCIEKDYNIEYLKETNYWGTAGSLALLPKPFASTFIVSNCDIIVKADFAEVLDFHRKSQALLTVLSSVQHHKIPYGVIKFSSGGVITELEEKPEMSFCVNTGVYILEAECLEYLPQDEVFHMTSLIERLIKDGKKVVTYPVNEGDYIDIGQWEEYRQAVRLLT